MDDDVKKCIRLMDRMLHSSEEFDDLLRDLQGLVWNAADKGDDIAWGIVRNLVYDLGFYEPDPMRRARDYAFYDKDRALREVKETREKLKELKER